jgi:hypothetical protein
MQKSQKLTYARLSRVRGFLDRHAGAVGDVNRSRARRRLDDVLASLAEVDVTQRSEFSRSARLTDRKHALRKTLLTEHIRPIVALAQAGEIDDPVLSWICARPRSRSDASLLDLARNIEFAIGEYPARFLELGIDEATRDQLVTARRELRDALLEQETCSGNGTWATAVIGDLIKQGCDLVRLLNALVVARIAAHASLMAEWRATAAVEPADRHSDD